jgi:hypothetical protein
MHAMAHRPNRLGIIACFELIRDDLRAADGRSLQLMFSTSDLKGVHSHVFQTLVISGSFTDGFAWQDAGQRFRTVAASSITSFYLEGLTPVREMS